MNGFIQYKAGRAEFWTTVADRVRERSDRDCRTRWDTFVDPRFKKTAWTTQELKLLISSQV